MNKHLIFSGKEFSAHFAHWSEKFSANPNDFSFFGGMVYRETASGKAKEKITLDSSLVSLVNTYSGQRDLETFILLLTGFFIVLSKYDRENTLCITTPLINNENNSQIWEKYIPIFGRFSKQTTIKEAVSFINEEVVKGYTYQNFPFDMVTEEPGKFSNVMIRMDGLHVEDYDSTADIIIHIKKEENSIDLTVEYTLEKFEPWRIIHFMEHFIHVFSEFTALSTKIEDIEIISRQEKNKLIHEFNSTTDTVVHDDSVVTAFERLALQTPDLYAVLYKDICLTYGKLNEKSNQLAHYLVEECKLQAGDFVGILLDKSDLSVIALLGILKAGGVYVPIDPESPALRISQIIHEITPKIIITSSDHLFSLENYEGYILAADIQLSSFETSSENASRIIRPDDTAYLIFTSGSQSKPKGVLCRHTDLLKVSMEHVLEFRMSKDDRYLQFMSIAFDGSLLDIFTTLLSGASLVILEKAVLNNTGTFLEALERYGVTVSTITPSYIRTLNKAALNTVRLIVSAGEKANVEDVHHYSESKDFYNGYGPSEATINTTLYKVTKEVKYTRVPIGKPRTKRKVYVLDDNLKLMPIGQVGQIAISGEGVFKGYFKDALLTEQKVVANPFFPEERVYLSGDLGYWLNDGNLVFVGRNDDQVKLNGFRVDLMEIEYAINTVPGIAQAHVAMKEDGNSKEVIAFYQKTKKIELIPSLGEYAVYDRFIYEAMATDEMRINGYRSALLKVASGKVFLDPGTGPDLILAKHCIESGAKKAYAVEIDEEAYEAGKKNLHSYGQKEKISFLKGDATQIDLPEPVDYCVSALAGNIASSDGCIPLVNAFKTRLGNKVKFIPNLYHSRIAAFGLQGGEEFHFHEIAQHYIDRVFGKFRRNLDLRICLNNMGEQNIFSDQGICEEIAYEAENLEPDAVMDVKLKIHKDGLIQGLVVWINAYYENHLMIDSLQKTHHLPVFFPVFDTPLRLESGDEIQFTFERKHVPSQPVPDYFIKGTVIRDGSMHASFDFSSPYNETSFRKNWFYKMMFDDNGKVKRGDDNQEEMIKDALSRSLPAYMMPNRFMQVREIPVTLNGKTDKKSLLALVSETIDQRETLPATNEREKLLVDIWENVLGIKNVGITDDFFSLGGDSIKAIQIASKVYELGYKLEVNTLFEAPEIRDLAELLMPITLEIDQSRVTGSFPLTPVQCEFFKDKIDKHHYNQALLIYAKEGFDEEMVKHAFAKILEHHDMLRCVFISEEVSRAHQTIMAQIPVSLEIHQVSRESDQLLQIAQKMQAEIDLEEGPLLKLGLFRSQDGDKLLIIIHHLVVDAVSWRILLDDIQKLSTQYKNNEPLALPLKTNSFRQWSKRLSAYANSQAFISQKEYWEKNEESGFEMIVKNGSGKSLIKDNMVFSTELGTDDTKELLQKVNSAYNTEINDILLSALALSVSHVFSIHKVLVGLESHGREQLFEEMDITRTVGWFSSYYPLVLDADVSGNLEKLIIQTKEYLRSVPSNGLGYGILKNLFKGHTSVGTKLKPQIVFNYLGQFDADFNKLSYQVIDEDFGMLQSPEQEKEFELEIMCLVSNGKLIVKICYNKFSFGQEEMHALGTHFRKNLQRILVFCKDRKTQVTPSDLTFTDLSLQDLDTFFD